MAGLRGFPSEHLIVCCYDAGCWTFGSKQQGCSLALLLATSVRHGIAAYLTMPDTEDTERGRDSCLNALLYVVSKEEWVGHSTKQAPGLQGSSLNQWGS